tara:strand:+ start:24 stop:494 length:471 start_codon:yes stop_codon:yes gene_type:complete
MTKEIKIIFAYFIILAAVLFGATKVLADCTGCGDDGHQVCPIEKKHKHVTIMKEEHKASSSEPEMGVVFAVCIFEIDETGKRVLVDHVASENLVDCLKNKREKEREYKESKEKPGIYNMTCDKVDAQVKVNEDGSWEILDILGRHDAAYEKKKVYE